MVGMPVFIDQGDVLTRMEEKGIGLGVDKTASSDAIYDTIVKASIQNQKTRGGGQ